MWTRSTFLLVAIFALTEVVANWLAGTYQITAGPFLIPAGSFLIPISLIIRDGLHLKQSRSAIWAALLLGAGASLLFSWQVARIAVASVLAFAISFGVDTLIFQALHRRSLALRMRWSNWASLPVDTLIFVPVAFAGVLPLGALIPGQVLIKLLMTEVAVLLLRLWEARDGQG